MIDGLKPYADCREMKRTGPSFKCPRIDPFEFLWMILIPRSIGQSSR